MQEEIENRTVNLAISTTKLTARGIIRLAAKGLAYIKRKSHEAALKNKKPDGRQTIQQLIGQNQGVTNIDISQTDLKGFEKYARKYGVDYAITKDKSVFPPKYLVFFKARDADAMTAAFNAYSAEVLAKSKRPSTLNRLHKLIDAVKSIPTKVTSRDKQREQTR
ncbi:PcfB family protein [Butyricicoccus sp. AM28-25]|nr:PcfB family protein [Butyricicoccus sp. AM28-25]RHT68911.1 PcfB family protein [Butyricicoccus sp. AM28-25]